MAKNRGAVTSKSYDYFVETSYLESQEEVARDLYDASPASARTGLPIVEDPAVGWCAQGLGTRIAASASEARDHFNAGCKRKATQVRDWAWTVNRPCLPRTGDS